MYTPSIEKFWFAKRKDGSYCVGSGDVEMTHRGLPKDVAQLLSASPTLLNALIRWREESDIPAPSYVLDAIERAIKPEEAA